MSFENRYSILDKWLHHIGFATGMVQASVSDIEDRLFARQLESIESERPVFITALPRAGTTILLNLLAATGEFATHTYRDIPFVLCPMVWEKFSAGFQRDDKPQERAHGDGVNISSRSPEAFEEILWRHFWNDHYREDCIEPWTTGGNEEFIAFFTSHMRKIIALRRQEGEVIKRYASKNNGNMARLGLLPEVSQDCSIIIPFRDPIQHAASLLSQHRRFLAMHSRDRFSAQYMAGIGHYDFGDNLKPINFDGWLKADRRPDAMELGFWLEYWIVAYRHILNSSGSPVDLLSYTTLSDRPWESLLLLSEHLGMSDPEALICQAGELRPPRKHTVDTSGVEPYLIAQSQEIFRELASNSIC